MCSHIMGEFHFCYFESVTFASILLHCMHKYILIFYHKWPHNICWHTALYVLSPEHILLWEKVLVLLLGFCIGS